MKKGLSLGEMLVSLFILGVVSALTIPMITQTISNQNKPLFRSAFNNVNSVVNELINDISIYPSGEFSNSTLCGNFFDKVNTIGTIDCTGPSSAPDTPNAITANGMKWYFFEKNFGTATCPDGASGSCIKISVDINGDKSPNSTTASDKDILDIYISQTGKVTVPSGSAEAGYLEN